FYVEHIRRWMPKEWELSLAVLRSIDEGKNEPELLDPIVKGKLHDRKMGSDALITERAGVLSRLTELRLILRRRKGIRVSYALTRAGQEYAAELDEAILTS